MALSIPYYPKSQIQPNLYTYGGEYMIEKTKRDYTGYYYKVSNGGLYTGKSPSSGLNAKLILIKELSPGYNSTTIGTPLRINSDQSKYPFPYHDFDTGGYNSITNSSDAVRFIPPYYNSSSAPRTQEEKDSGEYQRYFLKKCNELVYIEISKEDYKGFNTKNNDYAIDLYEEASLPWLFIPPPTFPNQVTKQLTTSEINKNSVDIIEKNKKWYGFSSYFQGDFG